MNDINKRDPIKIAADDINPRYNWGRHLPALRHDGRRLRGARIDYRRLHRYRLGRRAGRARSLRFGALLLFDDNNIRYVTSTRSANGRATSSRAGRC